MKKILNIIRCMLFLVAGLLILLAPYNKIKSVFPNAPAPAVVKVMGAIVLLCGIIIVLLYSGL